jgi:hypothetical protein
VSRINYWQERRQPTGGNPSRRVSLQGGIARQGIPDTCHETHSAPCHRSRSLLPVLVAASARPRRPPPLRQRNPRRPCAAEPAKAPATDLEQLANRLVMQSAAVKENESS